MTSGVPAAKAITNPPSPPFTKGGMGGFVVTIDLTAYSVQLHWCGGNRGK